MEIENGDFVKIVGDCENTAKRFKIVPGMKQYMRSDKAYQVYMRSDKAYQIYTSKYTKQDSVVIGGYTWDIKDVILVRKKYDKSDIKPEEPKKEIESFFKFDEKTLDI